MTTNGSAGDLFNNLQLQADDPERKVDDRPSHSERYEPSPLGAIRRDIVHYGPGNRPLCGEDDDLVQHTQDPHQVSGCEECLELVAEDLRDPDIRYGGYCLHCRREITATGSVEWRRVVRRPCPHCGRPSW